MRTVKLSDGRTVEVRPMAVQDVRRVRELFGNPDKDNPNWDVDSMKDVILRCVSDVDAASYEELPFPDFSRIHKELFEETFGSHEELKN